MKLEICESKFKALSVRFFAFAFAFAFATHRQHQSEVIKDIQDFSLLQSHSRTFLA
jgi:hypothetical protein